MKRLIILLFMTVTLFPVYSVQGMNSGKGVDKELEMFQAGTRLVEAHKPQEAITEYFDKGLAFYDKQYKDNPKRVYCTRSLNERLLYLTQAAVDKKDAVVISSLWADTHFAKAYALLELGRMNEAKVSIEKSLALSPRNARYWCELGYIYQQEKNWPKALEAFQTAEEGANSASPPDLKTTELLRAKRGLGYVFIELDRLDEAEAQYRQCLELDQNDQKTKNELNYIQGLRSRKALSQISLPPDADQVKNPQEAFQGGRGIYLTQVGFDLIQQGKLEEAVRTFKEAIGLKPNYAEAHEGLGRAYGNLNRWPEAIASFQEAIRLKPDFIRAHVGLGFALSQVNRNQESLNAFKEAVRLDPNLAIAHWGLATNYLKLGNRSEALEEYQVMQKLDPELARKFEKYLNASVK